MTDHKHESGRWWHWDHRTKTYYDLCACGARRDQGEGFDWNLPASRVPAADPVAVSREVLEVPGLPHHAPEGEWDAVFNEYRPIRSPAASQSRILSPEEADKMTYNPHHGDQNGPPYTWPDARPKPAMSWLRFTILCFVISFSILFTTFAVLAALSIKGAP